jgi:AraC-like DNA-binding protein
VIAYSTYPANLTLKRFIRLYMILRTPKGDVLNMLRKAKFYSALLLNFGATPKRLPSTYDFKPLFYNHHAWLEENSEETPFFQNAENAFVLCIVLTPIGVHHLSHNGSNIGQKNNFSFETLYLNDEFEVLTQKIHTANVYTEAVEMVESYFFNHFSALNIPLSNIDMAPVLDYIIEKNGVLKIKDLEDKFHLSGRWLEKQFLEQVGTSPKDFARATRFNALMIEVKTTPSVSWSDLTDKYGYYDQSHLIRDFHEFTNQSPTEFFKNTASINGLNLTLLP